MTTMWKLEHAVASHGADVSEFLKLIEKTTSHGTIVSVLPPGHAGGCASTNSSSGKRENCKALKCATKVSRLRHLGVMDLNKDDELSQTNQDDYVKHLQAKHT